MNEIINQGANYAKGSVIMYQQEVYKYWDEGNTRYVFINKDKTKVIKLPKDSWCHQFNQSEFDVYNNSSEEDRDKMALTTINEGVIEQEFCMPIKWAGKKLTIPQEIFARSCRNEVGWNSEGELVCFDLDEYRKY